ncbi:probable cytochrome P450 6a21 [Lucilia sericata]|uniref:probable cytochrome P450 6a21 n=1 Tax=Lucilia sericata TaxID=13632 RepID=UPI0018A83171|nr:probable cytochrome P450 6a21 [Lucilia sericata]
MFISLVLITIVLGLLSYIIWWYHKRLAYWAEQGIPHEKPHWLLGNFKGLMDTINFHEMLFYFYNKFKGKGPFAGFYFASKPTVFLMDPKLIQQVLIKDFSNFTDRGFYYNEEDDPLTGQLFLLDGQQWKNMRNKLSPTFTSGKMKHMFPIIIDIGEEFINVMAEEIKEHDNIIEIKDLTSRFTTDVIGTCAFGIDCNSLKEPFTEFRVMGKRAIKEQRHGLLINGIMQNFPELARLIHYKQIPDDIEKFYIDLVKQTVEYREKNNVRRNDLMDTLIDLKNKKLIAAEHGEELTNLTLNQIAAQAFVFFNAGFETSSTTMSFALYELARHREIQDKVRLEIDEVLEKYQQKFTYESMKEMKYLNQIIEETLRLYTIVPMINRTALSDYVVPGYPNYIIKKGMNISIPACAIHRDPDYYAQPEVFYPEHFAEDVVAQREPCVWLPFGEGPRNCIGMRFGKMQTIIGLVMLLRNFKFSVCEQTKIPLTFDKKSFMLATDHGIYLKVEAI